MIGTNPIGKTPVERVTAYLDHIDERDTEAQERGSGVQYGDSVHSFETLEGAYLISRADLRKILAELEDTGYELSRAQMEIDYLVEG